MLNIQKRREDACAVRKLARNTMSVFRGFRTKCFWSAMRPRIAFMGTNAQLFLCDLEDRTKHTAFDAQSGAVCRGCERTRHERNQSGYFIDCGKSLQQRARSD